MSMYDLDLKEESKINVPGIGGKKKERNFLSPIIALIIGFGLGGLALNQEFISQKLSGFSQGDFSLPAVQTSGGEEKAKYVPQTSQEEAVIAAVGKYAPAVVSIIVTKDMPVYERYYSREFDPFGFWDFSMPQLRQRGTEERRIGAGTGFIVSADGIILTNKHVVSDDQAQYTVVMSDQTQYSAKVLALDPSNDIAVVKIYDGGKKEFPAVVLGDSDNLQIGQSVIAIGNALGQFDNTVSVGVVSGMQRSITAQGLSGSEVLEDLIQTDAAINTGNSGGPLLNLRGEVIGINTAIASGAQNVGFVIPINLAKRGLEQAKTTGKIVYPYLGVYYAMISDRIRQENDLSSDYGAWVNSGDAKISSVAADSPASRAGIKDGDIILEMNGKKLDSTNSLAREIAKYNPGDKVELKVLRGKEEIIVEATLGKRKE